MLSSIPEDFPQPFCNIQDSDAAIYKVGVQKGHVIVHTRGAHQRKMTKQDCIGLISGYPPWYRETLIVKYPPELPPWSMRHPLAQGRDFLSRGGWVIAVPLSDTKPVPIYRPDPADPGAERGNILRGGCERVLQVLSRQDLREFLIANTKSGEYDSAIKLIEISIKSNTDSVSGYVRAPDIGLMQPDWRQTVCRAAIEIFDKAPALDISSQPARLCVQQQKRDVAAQLILHWASRGVFEIIAYVKNPGRELVLDSRSNEVSEIYLEDCRCR